jgi:hypothetical protein
LFSCIETKDVTSAATTSAATTTEITGVANMTITVPSESTTVATTNRPSAMLTTGTATNTSDSNSLSTSSSQQQANERHRSGSDTISSRVEEDDMRIPNVFFKMVRFPPVFPHRFKILTIGTELTVAQTLKYLSKIHEKLF